MWTGKGGLEANEVVIDNWSGGILITTKLVGGTCRAIE